MKHDWLWSIGATALLLACGGEDSSRRPLLDSNTGADIGYKDLASGTYRVGDRTFDESVVARVDLDEARRRLLVANLDNRTKQNACGSALGICGHPTVPDSGDDDDADKNGDEDASDSVSETPDAPITVWESCWDTASGGGYDVGCVGCAGNQCWYMRETGTLR